MVHGIGQYRQGPAADTAHYAAKWLGAARKSSAWPWEAGKFELHPAYYAHLLVEPGVQGGALPDDAQALYEALLDASDFMPQFAGAQGRLTSPLRAAMAFAAERIALSDVQRVAILKRFAREVAAFLRTEPGTFTPKHEVIAAVAEAFEGADVVLAHSLGSVVAYETLWKYGQRIPLLVTLGSPLALPHFVFPRLTPAPVDGKGGKPPGIGQWSNLADRGDFVAIPRGGVGESFAEVAEDLHDSIHIADFHRLANYLQSPVLGEILARWDASRPKP